MKNSEQTQISVEPCASVELGHAPIAPLLRPMAPVGDILGPASTAGESPWHGALVWVGACWVHVRGSLCVGRSRWAFRMRGGPWRSRAAIDGTLLSDQPEFMFNELTVKGM